MDIVGHGFLARHLRPIAGSHEAAIVCAAGVSAAGTTHLADFDRESALVYDVIRRCRRSGSRLVYFSTAAAGMYSVPGEPGREDGPVFPGTPYGRHKLAMEAVIAASGVDYLVLRLAHVVGEGQAGHQLLPSLVDQISSGVVRIFRGAVRDLIDVADVVAVVDHLLGSGRSREVVNVASGFGAPVERIVEQVQLSLGRTARWTFVEGTGSQPVCIDKLRALVPAVTEMGFGPGYYRRVLDRYTRTYGVTERPRARER